MIRELRLLLFFIFGLLFGGFATYASAETVAAGSGITVVNGTASGQCSVEVGAFAKGFLGQHYAISGDLITAVQTASPPVCNGVALSYVSSSVYSGFRVTTIWRYVVNGTVYNPQSLVEYSTGYYCPSGQNWTVSGATCTRPDCAAGEERLSDGICKPACAAGEFRQADGTCKSTCVGAQFYETSYGACRCVTKQPTTQSYSVPYASAKAGNLDPPSCSDGCQQVRSGVAFCPGGILTMVVGGSTTCYARVGQTGQICAPDAGGTSPIAVTLSPVSATPQAAGVGPTGGSDPFSTTPSNSDPMTCASSGGNWGVFNGKGTCYTPTPTDPVVKADEKKTTVTDPNTGKTTTTTTNNIETCTGLGACSSTTTTTVSSGGGSGAGAGTTTSKTTTSTGSGTTSAAITSNGNGGYNLQLPSDYQRDSTGQITNSYLKDLSDVIGKPEGDDSAITSAGISDETKKLFTDQDKAVSDALGGSESTGVLGKVSEWSSTMSSGWFSPIPMSGCTPFTARIGTWSWSLDHCPTAAKVSGIVEYCMWFILLVSGFRMLTTPINIRES